METVLVENGSGTPSAVAPAVRPLAPEAPVGGGPGGRWPPPGEALGSYSLQQLFDRRAGVRQAKKTYCHMLGAGRGKESLRRSHKEIATCLGGGWGLSDRPARQAHRRRRPRRRRPQTSQLSAKA
eukprot:15447234-Alexandrium_andersonii.AAC.1